MQISRLLAGKGDAVATIDGGALVSDAIATLDRLGIGALVVSTDARHIDGIVSERDVVRRLADRRGDLLDERVDSIMSRNVPTCSPDDAIESLMATMTNERVRHVPVVRDGALCGIVSIGDVVKSRIGELERDRSELLDYINAR